MKRISLNGEWKGYGVSPDARELTFKANVPGCVHTDLLNNNIINDIFWRLNGEDVQWIEKWIWKYEKEFEYESMDEKNVYIEFEGLDVYCEVFLNDIRIGRGNDMFCTYRFPVEKALMQGKNRLSVIFFPAVMLTSPLPKRKGAFTQERLYTRRMQCTYSWDWSNRYVTCGIYKEVNLCVPDNANIESVFVHTNNVDIHSAQIGYELELTVEDYCDIGIEIYAPDGSNIYCKRVCVSENYYENVVDIVDPQLWNPVGYGEQPLYKMKVYIVQGEMHQDEKIINFGIRTVKILQIQDMPESDYYNKCIEIKMGDHVSGENSYWDRNEEFSGFILSVNTTPIMCKGANWVPCEPFPSAESKEKVREILTLAKEANVNMLRVWGGGVFEQDFFYDECDRLGITVTQDFLMACGEYPEEDEEFIELVKKEAECAAKRLRNHPCLVWWSGDNENATYADERMKNHNGKKVVQKAIYPVLKRLDPTRRLLQSSPYNGVPFASITRGTTHNTHYISELFSHIRNEEFYDYTEYFEKYLCRFSAEHPTLGVISVPSLKKFMSEEDVYEFNEEIWRYHTKNNP